MEPTASSSTATSAGSSAASVGSSAASAGSSAAGIFNGYVLAHALFGLWELDLLEPLRDGIELDPLLAAGASHDPLLAAGASHDPLLAAGALLDPLLAAGLASRDGTTWRLTPAGVEVAGEMGFFVWAVGGYGTVFQNAADILTGKQAYGRDVKRDDGRVVMGSALAARRHVVPYVNSVVDSLHATAGLRRVVDVGCGNAQLLVELCRRHDDLTAVGVDISPAACELAVENVRRAQLAERITISCTNFRATGLGGPRAGAIWADTGLVTSFFMLHDLMSDVDRTVRDLRALRDHLPADARLLIADTVRRESGDEPEPPIFSLGFHLAHALMGVRLWSPRDYEDAFDAAGLVIERRIPTSIPATWLYLLR